jgi:uncharacterized protein YdgA (DUF945 family)
MKKIIASIIILSVLVIGGYYGSGLITQRTFNRNMALLNDTSGLSVQIQGYQRSLFSSKANLLWQIQTPEHLNKDAQGISTLSPAKTITFEMPLTVYHGPVMVTPKGLYFGLGYGSSEINLPAEYLTQFNQRFAAGSTQPKIDLALFVSFLDASSIRLDIPAFRLIMNQDGGELEWLGLTSEHRFSASLSSLSGAITLNGVRLSKQTERDTVEKITWNYNFHRSINGLYLGDLNMIAPSLVITDQGKPIYQLTGLDVSNSSDIEAGLFDSSLHASLINVLFDNKTYGPARVALSIKNLDATVLAEINNKVNQAQQLSDVARQQALLALLPLLPQLFSQGAAFEMTGLSITLPQGLVQGEFNLQLPKGSDNNPFQLLQKITGQGVVRLPVDAVNAFYAQSTEDNQKVVALIKAGALVIEGKDYVIQVKIANGQLLVNGHPFDSTMLQF